jgi:serine/threonine protein kinase
MSDKNQLDPATEILSAMLLRWRELRQQGRGCSASELCAEQPELAPQLAQRIAAVEAMERRLAAPPAPGDTAVVLTADEMVIDPFTVPGYELLEVLGRGGMGVVFKARHLALKRLVALKMIRPGVSDAEQLGRFRVEAEALARARHPNIIEIYEIGAVNGRPYFTMELVEGGSLARAPLGPPRQAAQLVLELAEAMHCAHERGIVHRDLKPANVLLSVSDASQKRPGERRSCEASLNNVVPKITDFGLAKRLEEQGQTHSGAILGTPSYMAPEQAEGRSRQVGPLADVYALGAILYELLAGRPPFTGETAVEVLLRVVSLEPVPPGKLRPDVPRDLESVCLKCLEKEPARRYPSAAALADDLRRFLAGESIRARRLGPMRRGLRWGRRHPATASLGALLVLSLLGLALSLGAQRSAPPAPTARAVELAPQARRILHKYCFTCHGQDPARLRGRLNVLDHALLVGPRKLVVPGNTSASLLIHRIEDGSMPPEEAEEFPRLSSDEIEDLKNWVAGGAPAFAPPGPDLPAPDPPSPLAAEVKEIFRRRCYDCHRLGKANNGIKVLNHDLLLVKRRVVVPGRPDESRLFRLLSGEGDKVMPPPPRPRLSEADRETVRRWILEGAPPFAREWEP